MTRTEIKRSLCRLGHDEFMTAIVEAAIARDKTTPAASVRSLTKLVGALSGALNDADRGAIACLLRDAADVIEQPLLRKPFALK